MNVQELTEILKPLDPYQKVRVVMTGLHMMDGEKGEHPCGPSPDCRFIDTDLPNVKPDVAGVIELIFSNE